MTRHGYRIGLLAQLWRQMRLTWALLWDPAVPFRLKLFLPGLAFFYFLMPVDLIPDVIPVAGQVDDLIVILLLTGIFIRVCPREVVEYHLGRMGFARTAYQSARSTHNAYDDNVVDGTWRPLN